MIETHGEAGLGADRSPAQLQHSPLALRGDLLVQQVRGELWFRDANTLGKIGAVELHDEAFCFLRDGRLAAYVQPAESKRCEIHVVDDQRQVRVFWGPEFAKSYDADEVFVSDDNYDIVRLELRDNGEARATGRIKPALAPWKRLRQLASLGDGRIITRGDHELYVHEVGKGTRTIATPDELVVHLVTLGDTRFWYSYSVGEVIDAIALARLGETLAVDARVGFAPEAVAHIAAAGTSLAVLSTQSGAAAIVLVDEHGTRRWRAEIPKDFYEPDAFPDDAWIAASERRVVLTTKSKTPALLAWDAATGKSIG